MGRCQSLASAGMSLLELANGMRNAIRNSEDEGELMGAIVATPGLSQAARGCFFCENCIAKCEGKVKVSEIVAQTREIFQNVGLIPRAAWSSVQVDQEWDIFTAYRAIHGIGYADLIRHITNEDHEAQTDCEVAFFPGCSLMAYGPELTREVFAKVEELGGKTTVIDECCGSPLKSAGFLDRAVALADRIVEQVVSSGVKTVVFACPGCKNIVSKSLAAAGHSEVACTSLAEFLLEHGVVPEVDSANFRIFRSCQDRDGSYVRATRELLSFDEEAACPTICDGCCGAGGAVSAYNPNQQSARVQHTLDQIEDGQTLVTLCPTCTYTFAFQQMQTGQDVEVKNYLELAFENEFDWPKNFAQLNGMWTGEYGAWLGQVFA